MPEAAKLQTSPKRDKARLRLWLRLLRTTKAIEAELREKMRLQFNVTLPRFDVLAALYRKPEGMLMSELSRNLMVSNGNVTGIIDRLVADALVIRAQRKGDRRTSIVRLTAKGKQDFEAMAAVHAGWVDDLLSGFSTQEAADLVRMLDDNRPAGGRK